MKNYKIAVAGTGYVGLSLGVLFAQHHEQRKDAVSPVVVDSIPKLRESLCRNVCTNI